jgi:hypothetical protein
MVGDAAAAAGPPAEIDTSVSHSARIWNYWLGGKDNYAADREAGDRVAAMLPSIVAQARADRAFLGRAIRYLATRRPAVLDIGNAADRDNTQRGGPAVAPVADRVDNDPLVLAHACALLTSTLRADATTSTATCVTRTTSSPGGADGFPPAGGAMLLGILHHIPDTDEVTDVGRLAASLVRAAGGCQPPTSRQRRR